MRDVKSPGQPPRLAVPMFATVVAVSCLNVWAAFLVASAVGVPLASQSAWASWVALALGMAAAALAVWLWRRYLRAACGPSPMAEDRVL